MEEHSRGVDGSGSDTAGKKEALQKGQQLYGSGCLLFAIGKLYEKTD